MASENSPWFTAFMQSAMFAGKGTTRRKLRGLTTAEISRHLGQAVVDWHWLWWLKREQVRGVGGPRGARTHVAPAAGWPWALSEACDPGHQRFPDAGLGALARHVSPARRALRRALRGAFHPVLCCA